VDLESAPETQRQSARMRSITHRRPPKGFSATAIENSIIATLISDLSHCHALGIIRVEVNVSYIGVW
jgi:hypothetical protein